MRFSRILTHPTPAVLEDGGPSPVAEVEDPSVIEPLKGGGYTALRLPNRKFAVRDVPIFSEIEKGERFNEEHVGKEWMESAVARAKAREAENGYLSPVHVDHHGFLNTDASGAGQMRLTRVGKIMYEGKPKFAIFADLINIKPSVYQRMKDVELPYRSVEILSWKKPEIASLALMEHHTPHFRLAMLTIEKELDASQTIDGVKLSAEENPELAKKIEAILARAHRGTICLSALGHPDGVVTLQKIEGYGKAKDTDAVTDPKGGEEENEDDQETCPECGKPNSECDCDESEGGSDSQKIDEILARVKNIEGYMDGSLAPKEEKKPHEEEPPDPEDPENKETSKMSEKLEKELAEARKQMAQLMADNKRTNIRLSVDSRLRDVKVPAGVREKIDAALKGENLEVAEASINGLIDGVLASATKTSTEDLSRSVDTSGDPLPSFESQDANNRKKLEENLPAEVMAFQSKGTKAFEQAVDLYHSWQRGRRVGVKASLKEFLAVNISGLGRVVKAAQEAKSREADEMTPDDEDETKE